MVEVTLALGIVTFGLVGVVGVLPTALASGRQSSDQNRAAAIANTLFASFRSQSFTKICYVDSQFDPSGAPSTSPMPPAIDFTQADGSSKSSVVFYARYLSLATDTATYTSATADNFGTQRRLVFFPSPAGSSVANLTPTGSDYQVALNFYDAATQTSTVNQTTTTTIVPPSNQPEGMNATGLACRVEIVINVVSHPDEKYYFVSTVANRNN